MTIEVTVAVEGGKEVFKAGETVKGHWVVENNEPIKVKGINCYFYGATYVKWTETEVINRSTKDIDYISYEKYANVYMNLFGRKPYEDGPNHVLEAGKHVYKFDFTFPDDKLPSSFEGIKGAVRYWLMIKIERPIWPDVVRHKCLTFLDDVNINRPFYATSPAKTAKKQISKALGFGDAGEVTLYGKLDRTGYCPGEQISIKAVAKNASTKDLGRLKASLVQSVEYRATGDTKCEETVIHTVQGAPIKQGETRNWNNQLLKIDAVPPSTRIRSCYCLSVDYYVKLLVDVPFLSGGDLVVKLPIVIGTVPQGFKEPQPPSAATNSPIHEIDARSSITYTKCNKGWSYFNRTPKSHNAFYKTNYTPMCAYVPNFKFVANKANTGVQQRNSSAQTKPAAKQTKAVASSVKPTQVRAPVSSSPTPNRPATGASVQPGTGMNPSAPPTENFGGATAPPSYDEVMNADISEQIIEDFDAEGSEFCLVFRFQETDTDKFKDTMSKVKVNLEKFQGEFTAISSKTRTVRGSWPKEKSVAIVTFPSKQSATDWLALTPIVSDPKWLDSCDILLVDCKEHFQEGRTMVVMYDMETKLDMDTSEYKEVMHLSNEVIKPIRLANGGSTMASSVHYKSLRGKLVADGHRFAITTWQSYEHYIGYPKHVPKEIYERFKELYGKCFKVIGTAALELQDLSVTVESDSSTEEKQES